MVYQIAPLEAFKDLTISHFTIRESVEIKPISKVFAMCYTNIDLFNLRIALKADFAIVIGLYQSCNFQKFIKELHNFKITIAIKHPI